MEPAATAPTTGGPLDQEIKIYPIELRGGDVLRLPMYSHLAPTYLWGQYLIPENVTIEDMRFANPGKSEWVRESDGTVVVTAKREGADVKFPYTLKMTYKPSRGVVDVAIEVTNDGPEAWEHGGGLNACYGAYQDVHDGDGTWVVHNDKLISVRDLMRSVGLEPGPEQWPVFAVKGGEVPAIVFQKTVPGIELDNGLVIRQSRDRRHAVGLAFDPATDIGMHFRFGCVHSDPKIPPLGAGETATIRGRVYIYETTRPEDILEQYRKDFAAE